MAKDEKGATRKGSRAKQIKLDEFGEIRTMSEKMAGGLGARDANFDAFERMHRIEPLDQSEGKSKETDRFSLLDPQANNVINMLVKMYIGKLPEFTVGTMAIDEPGLTLGEIKERQKQRAGAEKVERFVKALHYRNSQLGNLVADALGAAGIYGELEIAIHNALAEAAEPDCPFVLYVPHPKLSYPRYTRVDGLVALAFKESVYVGDVKRHYGDQAKFLTGADDDVGTLFHFIDRDRQCVWLDEQPSQPIIGVYTELGFVPWVAVLAGGFAFFEKEEHKRMPFIYALKASGLWAANNLTLTLMNDRQLKFGASKVVTKTRKGEGIGIDWSDGEPEIALYPDEDAKEFMEHAINPQQFDFSALLRQMEQSVTLAEIAAGSLRGGSSWAASAVQTLSAAARVSTEFVRQSAERALAQAYANVLRWIEKRGQAVSVWGPTNQEKLTPGDIGDIKDYYRTLTVRLMPDQQMERQMVAGLAQGLLRAGAGYDLYFRVLKEGGVLPEGVGVREAIEDMIERRLLDANLPAFAKESQELARATAGLIAAVPETPPAGSAPATPGSLPPLDQLMGGGGMGAAAPELQGGAPGGLPPGLGG